jgi:hypothetical protein
MFMHRGSKAQSTAEYVVVLGLIVAAVLAMQTYIKRGLQGRIKDAVDFADQGNQNAETGVNATVQFSRDQYEPYYLQSQFGSTRKTTDREKTGTGGDVYRASAENTTRAGEQKLLGVESWEDYNATASGVNP